MARMADPPAETVDDYLARLPPGPRALLQKVRRAMRAAAPRATEVISYRMPALRGRRILVYYAAFADHCSLFIPSHSVRTAFARELKPFASGKGTYRFTADRPLPAALATRIVKARVAEDAETRKR